MTNSSLPQENASVGCARSGPSWTDADLRNNPHAAHDKPQRVQAMFASIARRYDLNNRVHSLWRDQAWRRKAVALCELRPSHDVLDVACGTGDLSFALASNHPHPQSVTGLDFTEPMLEVARAKADRFAHRIGAPIQFRQGDAMALPFEDDSFDVVTIAFGIRNVAEPQQALREMLRVTRAGGRLVVLEFSKPRNRVMRWLNDAYCGWLMPKTATLIAGDRSGAYKYLPKSVASFPEGEAFVQWLQAAGFSGVETQRMTFGICTAYLAHVSAAAKE